MSPLPLVTALVAFAPAVSAAVSVPPCPQDPASPSAGEEPEDFFELSLEELMDIEVEVTSVTRQAQRVGDSAAAVTVLTREDIRRSGATTIAEVLRLVPGVQVARVNSNVWAVSARGFNDQIADKLLVLMDGRTLYTPLFSGMFWDVQDYPLEDIERIEVIRGPGGAVWGANAVNGVINIITRSAHDAFPEGDGGSLSLAVGDVDRTIGSVRYGARLDGGRALRVYARGFEREAFEREDGSSSNDEWDQLRAGFRVDSDPDGDETWTVQGDAYSGFSGNEWLLASFTAPPTAFAEADADVWGGNLLGRWTRRLGESEFLTLKAYWDATRRDLDIVAEERDTLDFELLHALRPAEGNRLTWGVGYRLSDSDIDGSAVLQFDPDERHDQLVSLFVHDEQDLSEDVTLIAGTKLEHNDFTGFELQPNLRLIWRAGEDDTVWAAVSRAVATPSQVDHDVQFLQAVIPGGGGNTLVTTLGDDDVDSEEVISYELGYRTLISGDLSLDLALFYNDYDELVTAEPGAPFAQGADIVQPLVLDNLGEAETWGGELGLEWRANERWTLHAGYSYLELDIELDAASNSINLEPDEGRSPRHQAHLRSDHELSAEADLTGALYYVDRLSTDDVPGYVRGDLVFEWRPRDDLELKLAGLGFFHDGEPEFGATNFSFGSELDLAAYFQLTWRF